MSRSIVTQSADGAVQFRQQGGEVLVELPQAFFVGRIVDRDRRAGRREKRPTHLGEPGGGGATMAASGNESIEEGGEKIVIGFHPAFWAWMRSVRRAGRIGQA